MNARLTAIAGPVRGSTIPLRAPEFTVGRAPGSSLCLDSGSVSRAHCVFREAEGGWSVADRGSRNGTIVNGARVEERLLASGDEIRVGSSAFIFLVGEDERPETRTSVLRSSDSVFLRPEGRAGAEAVLAALLRLSTDLARVATTQELVSRLIAFPPALFTAAKPVVRWLDADPPAGAAECTAAADATVVFEAGNLLVIPISEAGVPVALLRFEGSFTDVHQHIAGAISAIASAALDRVTQLERLRDEVRHSAAAGGLIGDSAAMVELRRLIGRVAGADASVLILGESGTGKELVARALHASSTRSAAPFVAINCAALTETLLESELFGHEKGAFTGATSQKRGRIEAAEGGTLFLDEIGELARPLQAKLLRVLQQREFERVGSVRTLKADVRVVAATNRDLLACVRTGTFREDLYYRLNVITLRTPPLRERREDIVLLAETFANRFAGPTGRGRVELAPASRAAIVRYDWPGNVRELENAMERAIVLGSGPRVLPEDLPEEVASAAPPADSAADYYSLVREAKRKLLFGAIEEAGGSHLAAAKMLGLNPTYLSRLLRNLDI